MISVKECDEKIVHYEKMVRWYKDSEDESQRLYAEHCGNLLKLYQKERLQAIERPTRECEETGRTAYDIWRVNPRKAFI